MLTLILALACGEKPDPTDDSEPTATDDSEAQTDDTAPEANPCEPDDMAIGSSGIHGTVTASDGGPVGCMRAQFCHGSCAVGQNNADGQYSISTNEDGMGALEFFPLSDDFADYFVTAIPYITDVGADYNVDVVLQKSSGWQAMPATATQVDMGDGLSLNLGADLVELPFGTDADTVGAVSMPESDWPPLIGLDHGGTVVAIYQLSPFDAHASSGLDFWISNAAIQETHTYSVYEFEVDTTEFIYGWNNTGTSVAEGGVGGTLHYLSMLVVVEEPADDEAG
jgi:hypothetical protein